MPNTPPTKPQNDDKAGRGPGKGWVWVAMLGLVSSTQDFNEFTYFIYNKINSVWSTADIVDVGPDHLTSEVAHHYRITKQTFAGPRAFKYSR